jgi:hypothetical protein
MGQRLRLSTGHLRLSHLAHPRLRRNLFRRQLPLYQKLQRADLSKACNSYVSERSLASMDYVFVEPLLHLSCIYFFCWSSSIDAKTSEFMTGQLYGLAMHSWETLQDVSIVCLNARHTYSMYLEHYVFKRFSSNGLSIVKLKLLRYKFKLLQKAYQRIFIRYILCLRAQRIYIRCIMWLLTQQFCNR